MCGIAGSIGALANKRLVPQMLRVMKHRGPDAEGFYLSDKAHIGHCRLAINDLSEHARQPFISEDKTVAVAVNGEIYNFFELKKRLEAKGYKFRSSSDCEIVLPAYMEYGLDFIPLLNGMFAISLWDDKKQELFLVRDRLGIKPLYYALVNNVLVFASEIKALAAYTALDFDLDLQSFAEYLVFENYFSNRTLNQNVKLVEPGQIITFSLKQNLIKKQYFWQANLSYNNDHSHTNVYNKYLDIIEASVNRHLISDVPLGSYLSSGFDSSSVAYWASKKLGNNLKTYTGFFRTSNFYNEASDAAQTAKELGCANTRIEITPEDFRENIKDILWHLDEPKVGMGAFSQYMVAQKAAQDIKVILTGNGGDELFAGYPVFKAIYGKQNIPGLILHSSYRDWLFNVYFFILPKIRKEIAYFLPNIYTLKSFKEILDGDFYSRLIRSVDVFQELETLKKSCSDDYQRLTLTYIRYYLPSLFIAEDKLSMAFSLESRTPLCDNEMIDFALSIPLAQKLKGYELKHIPRTAMRNRLPDSLYRLPKRGFPTPLRYWFKKELKEYIRDFICDNLVFIPMFNPEAVKKIVSEYQASMNTIFDEINAHKIWIILNLIFYSMNQKKRYEII